VLSKYRPTKSDNWNGRLWMQLRNLRREAQELSRNINMIMWWRTAFSRLQKTVHCHTSCSSHFEILSWRHCSLTRISSYYTPLPNSGKFKVWWMRWTPSLIHAMILWLVHCCDEIKSILTLWSQYLIFNLMNMSYSGLIRSMFSEGRATIQTPCKVVFSPLTFMKLY